MRPTTCTTAAAMPTGTAMRMAFFVDRRPTPMAIGANKRGGERQDDEPAADRVLVVAEAREHLAGRLVEHVRVVEDAAECGEPQVRQHRSEDEQGRGQLSIHRVSLVGLGSCRTVLAMAGGRDPRDEDAVGVVREVVAGEGVDELAVVDEVSRRDGDELAVARRDGELPGAHHEVAAVGGEERGGDQDHRVVAGARLLHDPGDRGRVADDELVDQLLGVGCGHGDIVGGGADTALTPD